MGSSRTVNTYLNQALTLHCHFVHRVTGQRESAHQRRSRLTVFQMIQDKTTSMAHIYTSIYIGDVKTVLAKLSEVGVASTSRRLHVLSTSLFEMKKTASISYPDFKAKLDGAWRELQAIGHPETEIKKVVRLLTGMQGDKRYSDVLERLLEVPNATVVFCDDHLLLHARKLGDHLTKSRPQKGGAEGHLARDDAVEEGTKGTDKGDKAQNDKAKKEWERKTLCLPPDGKMPLWE